MCGVSSAPYQKEWGGVVKLAEWEHKGLQDRANDGLREGLRSLAYELTLAESRERDRLARELHDGIGQVLAVARFRLGELRQADLARREALLDEIDDLLRQASATTRSTTFDLGTPALRLGLHEALMGLVERLHRLPGVRFQLEGRLPELAWPDEAQAVLLRVVRELCVNVQRHAHARQAWIHLQGHATQVTVTVTDDGIGIDPSQPLPRLSPHGGFGLHSAQAQVRGLGGSLLLESGPGAGAVATVSLPLHLGRP